MTDMISRSIYRGRKGTYENDGCVLWICRFVFVFVKRVFFIYFLKNVIKMCVKTTKKQRKTKKKQLWIAQVIKNKIRKKKFKQNK